MKETITRWSSEDFQPVRLLEVELSKPLTAVPVVDSATGRSHSRALSLVRLHSQPLGLVHLELGCEGLSAEEHAHQVWQALGGEVREHLRQDDLPDITRLETRGIVHDGSQRCLAARERALADATLVSVVVPTHDRPEHIETCLASLVGLEYPNYEIVVVDNAPSTPDTAAVVARFKWDPRVRYVREDRPGASWARNRGVIESRGEIIALTDDDVVVDRYWLVELVKAFRSAENIGCVTGNVLPRQLDTPAQAWFEERGGFSRGFRAQTFDTVEHVPSHPLYPYCAMMFGSGNNMAFRSTVLREIGGFDPALDPASPAHGGEDLAAFFEVIIRGYKLVYEPGALVHHLHRRDYEGLRRQMHGWGTGFAAYLTRSLLTHPRLLPDFMRKLPYAARVILKGRVPYSPRSTPAWSNLFPAARSKSLWRTEGVGYLYGLPAYMRSVHQARSVARRFGAMAIGEVVDV